MANVTTLTSAPLLYCTCGGLPAELTTEKVLMTSVADSVNAGEGHWTSHPFIPGTTLAIVGVITKGAAVDVFPALIEGDASEIQTQPLEVTNATTLAGLSDVRYTAIGW